MQQAKQVDKYSLDFENCVAEYHSGDKNDRSTKTEHDLYTKIQHLNMFLDFCKRYFDLAGGKRFLEVGCGTGAFSVAASLQGASVAATDSDQKAIDLARLRWSEHDLEGDLFCSDLRDPIEPHRIAAYDFVVCFQVIEHIPRRDQFAALANLFSMVAPGGFLFIDTENSLAPFDRHDTRTWLLRYLSRPAYEDIIVKLGRGINFYEPSTGGFVQTHDYLSYDEIIGAAAVLGFEVVSPFIPHGDKKQMLRVMTGSDWLHDAMLQHVDIERFAPISLLLKKRA